MSSASRSLHKKRRVLPRMNSLACWRSIRMPLLYNVSVSIQAIIIQQSFLPDQDHLLLQLSV